MTLLTFLLSDSLFSSWPAIRPRSVLYIQLLSESRRSVLQLPRVIFGTSACPCWHSGGFSVYIIRHVGGYVLRVGVASYGRVASWTYSTGLS